MKRCSCVVWCSLKSQCTPSKKPVIEPKGVVGVVYTLFYISSKIKIKKSIYIKKGETTTPCTPQQPENRMNKGIAGGVVCKMKVHQCTPKLHHDGIPPTFTKISAITNTGGEVFFSSPRSKSFSWVKAFEIKIFIERRFA